MENNTVSKILKGIGIGTIIVGVLASLITGSSADNIAITIGGIIGSVISGIIFIGFSEIIILLQESVDNQNKIIKLLNEKSKVVNEVVTKEPVTGLQDIENNLPKI